MNLEADAGLAVEWPAVVAARFKSSFSKLLPPQALTLLELSCPESDSCWGEALPPLVSALLTDDTGVFYVESGGPEPGGPRAEYLFDLCKQDDRLRYHLDQDLVVRTPPFLREEDEVEHRHPFDDVLHLHNAGWGRVSYPCLIPTVDNIKADLARQDGARENVIVVFDQVETMRPYFDLAQQASSSPALPYSVLCGWRAEELLTFAQSRTSPTVAVCESSGSWSALPALQNVSQMQLVLKTFSSSDSIELTISRRGHVADAWGTPVTFFFPVI